MAPIRLVVLISGSGSNLQACERGEINGHIAAVISNKADAYGLERAKQAGIATKVLSHKDFEKCSVTKILTRARPMMRN